MGLIHELAVAQEIGGKRACLKAYHNAVLAQEKAKARDAIRARKKRVAKDKTTRRISS